MCDCTDDTLCDTCQEEMKPACVNCNDSDEGCKFCEPK